MTTDRSAQPEGLAAPGPAPEVFTIFLGLGLTSFGGPVAHLGYFRDAFVTRRRWMSDRAYADLVALCQFLPGPSSSQVGMAIGLHRAGYAGMAAAWIGFTLPTALLLVAFAYAEAPLRAAFGGGWLDGLKAAAVAIVAHAVLGMAQTLAAGRERASIAVAGLAITTLFPTAWSQIAAIALGAAAGSAFLAPAPTTAAAEANEAALSVPVGRRTAVMALAIFAGLLFALPLIAAAEGSVLSALADSFYRSGALVFGGGHVVLPLLQSATVDTALVSRDAFLAGYGATQAMPGPLFAFAAYLGAVAGGPLLALVALVAIFAPAVLLLVGALPFWQRLRSTPAAVRALAGVNAAVVGILAAALYDPVFTEGITSREALVVAAIAFVALAAWKAPAWAVVIGAGAAGWLLL